MLNLNLNDSSSSQSSANNQSSNNGGVNNSNQQPQQNNIPCDLLGGFNLQNIDLLNDVRSGDKSAQRSTNTSNLDLLNELFHNEPNKQHSQPSKLASAGAGPDLLGEPSGAFGTDDNLLNSNKPNNSNLDPFEDLFGNSTSSSSSSNSNKATNGLKFPLNSTQSPLKPTQTKPTSSTAPSNNIPKSDFINSSSNKQARPDYNRDYFKEPSSSAANGPKLPEDAFGDLLGGFTKNSQNDWNKNGGKSMAQLKREEMVNIKSLCVYILDE